MGGNGSNLNGSLDIEETREYKTVYSLSNNIKVVCLKESTQTKMPEESRTPNRIYVTIERDGSDIHEISRYGKDHKKIYSIHTTDHQGLGPHVHYWKDGKPIGEPQPLSIGQKSLLTRIRNLNKNR